MGFFDIFSKRNKHTKNFAALKPGDKLNLKLENLDRKELQNCEIGSFVKFWILPKTDEIRIYRQGSIGGSGLLGYYKGKYQDLLMHHLKKDDIQNSTILSKSGSSMVIDFWIESRVEFEKKLENRDQEQKEKLIATLKKPSKQKYNREFLGRCDKLKEIKLRKGQIFDVEFLDFDYYITNMTTGDDHPVVYLVEEKGERVINYKVSKWDGMDITLLRNGLSSNKKIKAEIVELYRQNIEIIRFFDNGL